MIEKDRLRAWLDGLDEEHREITEDIFPAADLKSATVREAYTFASSVAPVGSWKTRSLRL